MSMYTIENYLKIYLKNSWKSNSVHEGLNVVPRLPSNVMDLRTKTQIKLKIEESCVMEEYHTFFYR